MIERRSQTDLVHFLLNHIHRVQAVIVDTDVDQGCLFYTFRGQSLYSKGRRHYLTFLEVILSVIEIFPRVLFVLYGGPEGGGGEGVVGDLGAGGVTVTPPQVSVELVDHLLHTVLSDGLHQVAGFPPCPDVVLVQVERVETLAVGQHRVKQTESLALLNNRTLLLSLSY